MTEAADHTAKPSPSRTLTWLSLGVMVMNAAGLLIVGPVIGVLNYFLARQFAQFDLQLPWLTGLFLATPWWVWCGVFLPLGLGVFVLELCVANKAATIAVNVIVGGVLLVFLAAYVLAMMLPMVSLMTRRA